MTCSRLGKGSVPAASLLAPFEVLWARHGEAQRYFFAFLFAQFSKKHSMLLSTVQFFLNLSKNEFPAGRKTFKNHRKTMVFQRIPQIHCLHGFSSFTCLWKRFFHEKRIQITKFDSKSASKVPKREPRGTPGGP